MDNTKNHTEDQHQEEMVSDNQAEEQVESPATATVDEEAQKGITNKAENELAEMKDKYLRLYSEFENFRRRTAKEKLDMIQSANEELLKSLLPVADDFERAEKAKGEANDSDEGFFLIANKFRKTLEQFGVKRMPIDPGADFDPDMQEAITQIPVTDDKLKGKVVDVVEKGYLLNEKVIRYAKVVVGQ